MLGETGYPVYNLAGHPIVFSHPVAALKPFAAGESAAFHYPAWIPETAPSGSILGSIPNEETKRYLELRGLIREPTTNGIGWIGSRLNKVSVWHMDDGDLIEIPGIGWFWTAADGNAIGQISLENQVEPGLIAEALSGPPLVLALIRKGVWCLHASAVAFHGHLIAFLGGSGSGKSTLARYLKGYREVKYVLDDILPVSNHPPSLEAYPHFPQLKLPLNQQPAGHSPKKMVVAALYLLNKNPEISIQKIKPSQSLITLAGNTVAARLFDQHLLEKHLEFCKTAIEGIPIHRLSYPHLSEKIPQVLTALLAHFEQISQSSP